MTVCFPNLIQRITCPLTEFTFSPTAPTCVRVVVVREDISTLAGRIPPPVHFFVSDGGQFYQIAPTSNAPNFHAILDPAFPNCLLLGVEGSNMTLTNLLPAQVEVLPGAIRYISATFGIPLASFTSLLPPQLCPTARWDEILDEANDCLVQTPPPVVNFTPGYLVDEGGGSYGWYNINGVRLFGFLATPN
jgi:hypothetical protein